MLRCVQGRCADGVREGGGGSGIGGKLTGKGDKDKVHAAEENAVKLVAGSTTRYPRGRLMMLMMNDAVWSEGGLDVTREDAPVLAKAIGGLRRKISGFENVLLLIICVSRTSSCT